MFYFKQRPTETRINRWNLGTQCKCLKTPFRYLFSAEFGTYCVLSGETASLPEREHENIKQFILEWELNPQSVAFTVALLSFCTTRRHRIILLSQKLITKVFFNDLQYQHRYSSNGGLNIYLIPIHTFKHLIITYKYFQNFLVLFHTQERKINFLDGIQEVTKRREIKFLYVFLINI